MSNLNKLTLLSIFLLTGLSAQQTQEVCSKPSPHPERVTLRHIESKGIGYNQGYTTLEGFFTVPNLMDTVWFPFLDIRGHLFNDKKSAANAGVGLRYLRASHVWGVNSYFDYRNTEWHHYNQYGIGFECLGQAFDFRLNGYFPFGKRKSSYTHAKFVGFKGHNMILSRRREFAFAGLNAEVGAHAKLGTHCSLYTALGSYYIDHGSRNSWGGELRLAFDITDYFRIEGNTSYDRIFQWIGQGQISLNLHFGPKKQIQGRLSRTSKKSQAKKSFFGSKKSSSWSKRFNTRTEKNTEAPPEKKSDTCSKKLMLRRRALQRIDRHEIIAVEKRRFHPKAINPATGQPYFFIFVNNASHSDGTFESPYPTLTLAQANSGPGDIIMVFPGTGAPYLDQPITLKDTQKLWGTGLSYPVQTTVGAITIPPFSSSFPTISTTITTAAVTLGNSNEIAGMQFSNTHGIAIFGGDPTLLGHGITHTHLHQNIFSNGGDNFIALFNCFGNLEIDNNQLSNNPNTVINIFNTNFPVNSNLIITDNTISSSGLGIQLLPLSPSGQMNIFLARNSVKNSSVDGVDIVTAGFNQNVCGTLQNNSFTNVTGSGIFVINSVLPTATFNLDFVGNIFTTINTGVQISNLKTSCSSFLNNTALNAVNGYVFGNVSGTLNVEDFGNFSLHNTGTILVPFGPVTSVPVGTCSCP